MTRIRKLMAQLRQIRSTDRFAVLMEPALFGGKPRQEKRLVPSVGYRDRHSPVSARRIEA